MRWRRRPVLLFVMLNEVKHLAKRKFFNTLREILRLPLRGRKAPPQDDRVVYFSISITYPTHISNGETHARKRNQQRIHPQV